MFCWSKTSVTELKLSFWQIITNDGSYLCVYECNIFCAAEVKVKTRQGYVLYIIFFMFSLHFILTHMVSLHLPKSQFLCSFSTWTSFFLFYFFIFASVLLTHLLSLSSNRCLVRQGACRSKCSHQSHSPAQQLISASLHSLIRRPQILPATFILDNDTINYFLCW